MTRRRRRRCRSARRSSPRCTCSRRRWSMPRGSCCRTGTRRTPPSRSCRSGRCRSLPSKGWRCRPSTCDGTWNSGGVVKAHSLGRRLSSRFGAPVADRTRRGRLDRGDNRHSGDLKRRGLAGVDAESHTDRVGVGAVDKQQRRSQVKERSGDRYTQHHAPRFYGQLDGS